MNCQFEFTVTQYSVAYGKQKQKQTNKQTKKKKKKKNTCTILWCLIIPSNASLVIYRGSSSNFAIIGIAKIGLSGPGSWGIHDKRGYQVPGGSHIDICIMCLPFVALFCEIWYGDRGGFHQRQRNPNHINWVYFGQIIVKSPFLSKMVYWWVGN